MSSTIDLKKQLIKVMASDLSVLRFIATELEWKKVNLMEANKTKIFWEKEGDVIRLKNFHTLKKQSFEPDRAGDTC